MIISFIIICVLILIALVFTIISIWEHDKELILLFGIAALTLIISNAFLLNDIIKYLDK